MGFLNDLVEKQEQKQKDKEAKELEKFMKRYNLYDLDSEDLKQLRHIADDLVGNGLGKLGMKLSFDRTEEIAKVTYLSALVEQNWMIIRQLARMNKNLEELKNK